jgi:hypothetical protein
MSASRFGPGLTARTSRRLFPWERVQAASALIAARERRQRRLGLVLWLAVVAFCALFFALVHPRCFGQ